MGYIEEDAMSSKAKIGLVVAGHIVSGLLLVWSVHNVGYTTIVFQPRFVALWGLFYAEAGLLGIWGALGTSRLYWRMPAVTISIAYLWALLRTAKWHGVEEEFSRVAPLSVAIIFLVLVGLRHGRCRLRLTHSVGLPPSAEGLQFTIRHLLVATAVVAVILGISPGIRTFVTTTQWASGPALGAAVESSCFILVELSTFWAALSIRRPMPSLAVSVPTAFMIGLIPAIVFTDPVRSILFSFFNCSSVFGIQAIITAASLLVVRSCGWRLVRGTTGENLPTAS